MYTTWCTASRPEEHVELPFKNENGMMLTTNHNQPRSNLAKTQTSETYRKANLLLAECMALRASACNP
jgi:hypothetical protein